MNTRNMTILLIVLLVLIALVYALSGCQESNCPTVQRQQTQGGCPGGVCPLKPSFPKFGEPGYAEHHKDCQKNKDGKCQQPWKHPSSEWPKGWPGFNPDPPMIPENKSQDGCDNPDCPVHGKKKEPLWKV